jgi:hypothetical protein
MASICLCRLASLSDYGFAGDRMAIGKADGAVPVVPISSKDSRRLFHRHISIVKFDERLMSKEQVGRTQNYGSWVICPA